MKVGFAGAVALIVSSVATAYAAGVRVNASHSMPIGLWMTEPSTSFARGDIVTACPPINPSIAQARDRGWLRPGSCPSGLQPLLKTIAAIEGDYVVVAPDGTISVNGKKIPDSKPMARDGQGRGVLRTATGHFKVAPGFVWLIGRSPDSFDSRYFGPVSTSVVTGAAYPIFVVGR